jgi:hypothetical protein
VSSNVSPTRSIVKSPGVYAVLRSSLGPWFKATGFKRAKGVLSYCRLTNGAHTVVWCQISQDGWDAFAGSKFVVEFQRSRGTVVGELASRRQRLAAFLSVSEREELRSIQNAVIAALPRPPRITPCCTPHRRCRSGTERSFIQSVSRTRISTTFGFATSRLVTSSAGRSSSRVSCPRVWQKWMGGANPSLHPTCYSGLRPL